MAITVQMVEDIEVLADWLVPLVGYELGPSGTEFSTPVELRFAVSSEQLEAGLTAVLQSADGSFEPIGLDAIEENGSIIAVAKVDHFSVASFHRIHPSDQFSGQAIDLPPVMNVGTSVPLGFTAGSGQIRSVSYRSIDQRKFLAPLGVITGDVVPGWMVCLVEPSERD